MRAMREKSFISILIPLYNEAENIELFLTKLQSQLSVINIDYEIVLVDDGSTDSTAEKIIQIANDPSSTVGKSIKLIQFSRNFGKELALTAGLEAAKGDAVIMIDGDSQHPLELLPQMLDLWQQGYDMVYGVRSNRPGESALRRGLSKLFYKLLAQSSSTPITPDAGDFRLLSRNIVNALNNLPERARFMKGLYSWVGFKSISIPFKVEKRANGQSSFNFRSLMRLAITGFTSFSNLPLRMWVIIGTLISFFSFCYALLILTQTLLYGIRIPGWATLTIMVLFLGGIQLLSIGILGEYIGQIFIEVKGRPHFIISNVHDFAKKD
jgi:glycosyltransferase involved in cell wall biosynthesis